MIKQYIKTFTELVKDLFVFFYKYGFGIKKPTKFEKPMNKENETEIWYLWL